MRLAAVLSSRHGDKIAPTTLDGLTAQAYNEAMNTLPHEKRCAVIRCLVDGCSIRATTRITGVAKNTIQKLTRDLGKAVWEYHNNVVKRLTTQRAQCDEIWCFCYAKDKNLPDDMRGEPGVGSIWTWTALDADSKLMISWQLGARVTRLTPMPSWATLRAGWRTGCN